MPWPAACHDDPGSAGDRGRFEAGPGPGPYVWQPLNRVRGTRRSAASPTAKYEPPITVVAQCQ
eukprot:114317-Hanusia_phi.AAC.1